MIRSLLAACVFAVFVAPVTVLHAQRVGGFGTTGIGGASALGSSGLGAGSMGSRGFGSGFGSSAFGASGFGSSGFGSSSFGSGFGSGFGSSGFGSSGFGGSTFGFGGAGGQSFVGRDSTDMANTWNQMGRAGAQFFNQMNRSMNRNRNNQQQPAKIEHVPQEMLVSLQVGFTPMRPSPAELTNDIRTRLGKILASQGIAAPQLAMEGDIAVLRGVAATESQRVVLEKLVAMEPGVRAVRNEMTVVAPSATQSLPAGRN